MLSPELCTTTSSRLKKLLVVCSALTVISAQEIAAQATFASAGANAASVQPTVDAFRTALGTLNANVAGSFGSGRREINWDGVPDGAAAPNALPANFFNVNSPRGVILSTPGTGFQVSATAGSPAAVSFANINPIYGQSFKAFSAQRLFTPIGSNITDVSFFVPGSTTVATTSAFGVVFSDVDLAATTSLQFFDVFNNSLGIFNALNFTGDQTFSFLGVQFTNGERVSRVRITTGNQILTAGNNTGDAVAMDDFIYAEPVASTVPEPTTVVLLAFGMFAVGITANRRARKSSR
ncbi:MAG: PEP-CTERM sorting domain-containing protein [Gemmatimonadaceae bacterium]